MEDKKEQRTRATNKITNIGDIIPTTSTFFKCQWSNGTN